VKGERGKGKETKKEFGTEWTLTNGHPGGIREREGKKTPAPAAGGRKHKKKEISMYADERQ